jgi:hypothetical protein
MQQAAPEVLTIKVHKVDSRREKQEWGTRTFVSVVARVVSVQRTQSKLKAGQFIRINYSRDQHTQPLAGPGLVPLLKVWQEVPAFLRKNKDRTYAPAAGGFSFETVS